MVEVKKDAKTAEELVRLIQVQLDELKHVKNAIPRFNEFKDASIIELKKLAIEVNSKMDETFEPVEI